MWPSLARVSHASESLMIGKGISMWPKPDHSELLRPSFRTSVGTIEEVLCCLRLLWGWSGSLKQLQPSYQKKKPSACKWGPHRGIQNKRQRNGSGSHCLGLSTSCSRNQLHPWLLNYLKQWIHFSALARFRFHSAPRWPNKIDTTFSRCQYKPPKHKQCPLPPCSLVSFHLRGSPSETCISFVSFPLVLSLAHLQPWVSHGTLFFWLVPGPVQWNLVLFTLLSHQHTIFCLGWCRLNAEHLCAG